MATTASCTNVCTIFVDVSLLISFPVCIVNLRPTGSVNSLSAVVTAVTYGVSLLTRLHVAHWGEIVAGPLYSDGGVPSFSSVVPGIYSA